MWDTVVVKTASAEKQQCEQIMARIYEEDPSKWPYGLTMDHLDGGCWLLRKSASQPVGFVGWQERIKSGKRIGYYAVGILPEYRGEGYGKTAVQNLLLKQARRVDEVRALIVSHNEPSLRMAESLGVPVDLVKSANAWRKAGIKALELMGGTGAGATNRAWGVAQTFGPAAGMEVYNTVVGGHPIYSSANGWDHERLAVFGLNTAFGRMGRKFSDLGDQKMAMITAGLTPFTKDLATISTAKIPRAVDAMESAASALGQMAERKPSTGIGLADLAIGGALAMSPVALAMALSRRKGMNVNVTAGNLQPDNTQPKNGTQKEPGIQQGTIRVTLPTKNPGDQETVIDMPLEEIQMSKTLRSSLRRDLLRRLRAESSARTRFADKGKLELNPPAEWREAAVR